MLKIDGRDVPLSTGITSIGRTTDNAVSFPDDANVSRAHAEIEYRGGEYVLVDLNSSNGTTINGQKLCGEKYLTPGDIIVLGGTSRFEFAESANGAQPEQKDLAVSTPAAAPAVDAPAAEPAAQAASADAGGGGSKTMLLVAGGIACLALLLVGVAAVVFLFAGSSKGGSTSGGGGGSGGGSGGGGGIFSSIFGSKCEAKATITKPETGDNISAPTEIQVDVEQADCVSKAVFTIDGNEFASAEEPFTVSIDPKDFPDLSDGVDHNLAVILMDEDGNPIGENAPILLGFETRAVTKPTPGPEVAKTNTQQQGSGKAPTLPEIQDMTTRLVKDLFRENSYVVSNKQFLSEVQKRTSEYAQDGYYDRASKYSDVIKVSFVNEFNVKAPLAFILAMSRSKFDPAKVGTDEGLWRMSEEFITSNNYHGTCAGVAINDPSQSCAAKAAARYLSLVISSAPGNDPIYSAVVFGKSTNDAAIWFSQLGPNRTDPWNTIRTGPEREQLVRFFAAGIVSENPQKFGLKKYPPLSDLYRNAM